jgi:SAM-dependent methyltransferase
MNPATCPLCGSKDNRFCFSVTEYNLVACDGCELFFIDPYPATDGVHDRVETYNYDEVDLLDPEKHYRLTVEYYYKYFPIIERECQGAGSVLDVGCGTGRLLELLGQYPDLHREGIELSVERAEMAEKLTACEIHKTPIEVFESESKFDVIIMINVLSHIPNFDGLFKAIHALLSPKGKLIIKTGEMRQDVKKGDYYNWAIPDHLHFLGLRTLDFICDRYNFKSIRHDRIPIAEELFSRYRWKSAGRTPAKTFIKKSVSCIPFALPVLANIYELTHGRRIFSSFIVLTPDKQL